MSERERERDRERVACVIRHERERYAEGLSEMNGELGQILIDSWRAPGAGLAGVERGRVNTHAGQAAAGGGQTQ